MMAPMREPARGGFAERQTQGAAFMLHVGR
jgi:hypothetical protein